MNCGIEGLFFFFLHSPQSMKLSFLPFLKDIKSNKTLWLL